MAELGFRGILKSASIVGAGMIFSKAISLLAETIIARQLAATEFGAAIFAYTILLTFGSIALLGIPEGFTYYLSIFDERGEDGAAFWTVVSGVSILVLILGISFVALYAIPFPIVEDFGVSREQWRWITLLAPLVIVYPVSRLSFGIMRGYDRSVPKVLSDDVLNKVIAFAALGIAIWQNANEFVFLSFYLGQYFLSSLLAGSYTVYLLRVNIQQITTAASLRTEARQLFSYSWPLALKNATRRILGSTDILLIGTLVASSSAVGYYRVGYVISQLGMITLLAISYLYTPRIARRYGSGDLSGTARLYKRATKWGMLLTFPIILPLVHYPSPIIEFLFGSGYQAGSVVLLILSVDVLLRVGLGPASATLQGIDRTKPDFVTTAFTTLLNLALSYLLVLQFGIIGAALGTLISMLFLNITQAALVYRYTSTHPYSRQYLGGVLAIFVTGLLLSSFIQRIFASFNPIIFGLPVSIPTFVFLFVLVESVVVWFGGLLSQTEKEQIRDTLYNKRFDALR